MDLSKPLVLPSDVRVEALEGLSPSLRSRLGPQARGYLVYRDGSRSGMSVVSTDTGVLLLSFRTPKTVAQALRSAWDGWSEDDRGVVESCLRVLESYTRERLLVPVGEADAQPLQPSLEPGGEVGGFRVRRSIRVALESEVYQVESPQGELAALKIARDTGAGREEVVRGEIRTLQLLGGEVAPRLLYVGYLGPRPYAVMEWIRGDSLELVADDYRMGEGGRGSIGIWHLGGRILDAYAILHAKGVIHGDVRPSNILVTGDGEVRVIDFGFSLAWGGEAGTAPPRGGLEPFLDPELARSLLAGSAPPPPNEVGEQYSIAALLFLLCTGEYYCHLSPYRRRIREQILSARPRTFAQAGAPAWPEGERILRRGLEKRPEDRFSSVLEMAEAWRQIPPPGRRAHTRLPTGRYDGLLLGIRRRLGVDGGFCRHLLGEGPTASVNRGAGGIAYGLYRIACATDDPSLLAAAQVWLRIALDESRRRRGFSGPGDSAARSERQSVSTHHSRSGLGLVRALLGRATWDRSEETRGVQCFIEAGGRPVPELDVIHGRAGVLLGASSLWEVGFPGEGDRLFGLGCAAAEALLQEVARPAPISDQRENLGIAHGWAGLLYALLRWYRATGRTPPTSVHDRVTQLARLARRSGRGFHWPWVGAGANGRLLPHMAGWCNGSAGLVHLFTLAWEMSEDPGFLEIALGAGWDVWDSRSLPAYDLCCGLGGRAYSLLGLYRSTGETAWAKRARRVAERAVEEVGNSRDAPLRDSLYRGELGVAVLAAELALPEEATMPFFEPEDWSAT